MSKKQEDALGEEPRPHHHREEDQHSIIQPIIDDLKGETKTVYPSEGELGAPNPSGPGHPPQPAELDQNSGGGYNSDGTYPQT